MKTNEVEVKIKITPDAIEMIRKAFLDMGFKSAGGRQFEENLLLDFDGNPLKDSGCALRLRRYGRSHFLTYKGPKQDHPTLKIREEIETSLGEFDVALQIFERLGLSVRFKYEKHREKLRGHFQGEDVEVCIDETPVGCFVEIESSAETIEALAAGFGWTPDDFITRNYIDLYKEHGFGEI